MCGYCIEGGFLIPLLESSYTGKLEELNGCNISSYLKEEDSLYVAVDRAEKFEEYDAQSIILCRLYEKFILFGFDSVLYKKITSVLGHDLVNIIRKKISGLNFRQHIFKINEKLCDKEIYQNYQSWDGFISDKAQLIEDCSNVLNFYYDWWLKGNNRRRSDGYLRLIKTGVMDPIQDTPESEWERFYILFPSVYFSMVYLWKYHHSQTDLIEKIALTPPSGTPDFEGFDLWLQRKAFIFFIQKVGIINALAKIDGMRVQLIYYALLKCKVSGDEIKIIVELLRENPGGFGLGDEVEYYISQIEDVIISALPY